MSMNHRVEICPAGANLVIMNGKMGIEFTGHALKAPLVGSIQLTSTAISIHNNSADACHRLIDNLSQTATGATDKKSCTSQFRHGLRECEFGHQWETSTQFNGPAQAHRDIPRRSLGCFNLGETPAGLPHHFKQVI